MIITKTPYRVSFFGGGTDYPDYYREHGGRVLSTSIDKYCYISVRKLPPFFQHKHRIVYSKIECVNHIADIEHPAVREIFQYLNIQEGLELHYDGDLPSRSGVGSSSAFTVGLLHSLYVLQGKFKTPRQLFEEALHVEQDLINEPVGSQDQVACAVGGFNIIDFHKDGEILVTPVTIQAERRQVLQDNLLMFFTGIQRYSHNVSKSKVENISINLKRLDELKKLTQEAINVICDEDADLDQFGELLHQSWLQKRELSNLVSNDIIDTLYARAMNSGALGGKLLGAGGGGFLLFYVPPEAQSNVRESLSALTEINFTFDRNGSQIIIYDR